jgi:hypothetical protein
VGSKYPHSISMVRSANGGSAEICPRRIIPEAGKVAEHSVKAVGSQPRRVFDERERRLGLGEDARELGPQAAPAVAEPSLEAGR